jgi:hypothetical protein
MGSLFDVDIALPACQLQGRRRMEKAGVWDCIQPWDVRLGRPYFNAQLADVVKKGIKMKIPIRCIAEREVSAYA